MRARQRCGVSCLSQTQAAFLLLPGSSCSGYRPSALLAAQSHSSASSSGFNAARLEHVQGARPLHTGQSVPLTVLLETVASQLWSWPHPPPLSPALHSHQTRLAEPRVTFSGPRLPLRVGCHCEAKRGLPCASVGSSARSSQPQFRWPGAASKSGRHLVSSLSLARVLQAASDLSSTSFAGLQAKSLPEYSTMRRVRTCLQSALLAPLGAGWTASPMRATAHSGHPGYSAAFACPPHKPSRARADLGRQQQAVQSMVPLSRKLWA